MTQLRDAILLEEDAEALWRLSGTVACPACGLVVKAPPFTGPGGIGAVSVDLHHREMLKGKLVVEIPGSPSKQIALSTLCEGSGRVAYFKSTVAPLLALTEMTVRLEALASPEQEAAWRLGELGVCRACGAAVAMQELYAKADGAWVWRLVEHRRADTGVPCTPPLESIALSRRNGTPTSSP